jgi:hypothetical protein
MDRQELINSITDENQRNFIKISRRGLFEGVSMLQERWQKVVELEGYYF